MKNILNTTDNSYAFLKNNEYSIGDLDDFKTAIIMNDYFKLLLKYNVPNPKEYDIAILTYKQFVPGKRIQKNVFQYFEKNKKLIIDTDFFNFFSNRFSKEDQENKIPLKTIREFFRDKLKIETISGKIDNLN